VGPTEILIQEFARQGHPLGRDVALEESPLLIEALRERLEASPGELDLSPASLDTLEQRLVDLHKSMQDRSQAFSEPMLVQLVREMVAYIGRVMVDHAGGEWRNIGTLWGTEVVFRGPVEVVKGEEIRVHANRIESLGNIAASSWDAITAGVRPGLYKMYRQARSKHGREIL
jgi:hypothetical protein